LQGIFPVLAALGVARILAAQHQCDQAALHQPQAKVDVFLDLTEPKSEDRREDDAQGGFRLTSSEATPKMD
jgi:hypothetical protein